MPIFQPTKKNIERARRALKKGEVIVYPTDTLYGFGADIFNSLAVKRVFELKGRSFNNPISIMVSDLKQIKQLAWVDKGQERIIKTILPGPFTILLRKKDRVPDILTAGSKKIGIRMPKSKICQQLSKGLALTTTSANLSGVKPSLNLKKIFKDFGKKINFFIQGKEMSGQASIIIDLTEEPFKLLRF